MTQEAKTEVIYGVTGEYAWVRRQTWFWNRRAMEMDGWYHDGMSGPIRPVMVFRYRRPNGTAPSILWLNKTSAAL
jgi:hypothetical protein